MDIKEMFNESSVATLAGAIQAAHPPFDRAAFLVAVFDAGWPERELKERIRHISGVLHDLLPQEYGPALAILRRAMPAAEGITRWVFTDYVEVYGLDHWQASISALEEFTPHMSAEFAIRPFIVRYPERTMAQMLAWAGHENDDVRRLASEGCRPRLPWGIRLQGLVADPAPILPILERLKGDPCESVRRSVANNLNDIAKDHPGVVLEVLGRWQAEGEPGTDWIVSHALRTLLKQGHPGALALVGYGEAAIDVRNLAVEPAAIPLGGEIVFSFDVASLAGEPQDLMIDFVLHLARARGKRTPKVFKLTKRTLQPGEVLRVEKTFSFEPVTTRKYYPGEHAIEPQINGATYGSISFQVG